MPDGSPPPVQVIYTLAGNPVDARAITQAMARTLIFCARRRRERGADAASREQEHSLERQA